ncbi:NB-ARC domain-containing protein [Laspinema olomoucense]|uniref:NB-ARC domain-containing protein n=1 Tax=Laspinema olomoucense D3b TaxID=2953688 RepID=A0ABT2N4D0_9CYAN|nr:NB-ARC domain-containing protein [Laspinema sp. D3b]MCT7977432.1 NB-ARC domain-containing protein [Laspinema sp. D3b]
MDVQQVLQWADELVFERTGKHLTNLQQAVLLGVWDHQKYREIAQNYRCTEANVKKASGALLQLISQELGKQVTKSNLRATMERYHISNVSSVGNFVQSNLVGGNINLCGESWHSAETTPQRSPSQTSTDKHYDITDAPERDHFYDRTDELTTLKQWIVEENIRLVNLIGLSGIGKTALAVELLEQIKDRFDIVIWRSHNQFLQQISLENNLLEVLSQYQEPKLTSILEYLRSYRCLIILDDLQEIFTRGELAGKYLPAYQNYGKFLKKIAALSHNSCFVLISSEKPLGMATLEAESLYCRTLNLTGLGDSAGEIFKTRGLTDEEKWLELITLYDGNPYWLNIISTTILDLFNGSVTQFLSCPMPFLGDLKTILSETYLRLSELEKSVMFCLARVQSLDVTNKPTDFTGSHADFLEALQSLCRRFLVNKNLGNGGSTFNLPPVIKEYMKSQILKKE